MNKRLLFVLLFIPLLSACTTSRTVQFPFATVVVSVERMYPAVPLKAEIFGYDPREAGFQDLANPAAGVTRPDISGSPRLVRGKMVRAGTQYVLSLTDYRGKPASIDTDIVVDARGESTQITVFTRDWNTWMGAFFHAYVRDTDYEKKRVDEIVLELSRK